MYLIFPGIKLLIFGWWFMLYVSRLSFRNGFWQCFRLHSSRPVKRWKWCNKNAFQRKSIPTSVKVSLIFEKNEKNGIIDRKEMKQNLFLWRNNGDIYDIVFNSTNITKWQVFKSTITLNPDFYRNIFRKIFSKKTIWWRPVIICFYNYFYTIKPRLLKF